MGRFRGTWWAVAVLLAATVVGSCSSDDSGGSGSAYVVGEIHGEMADEVVDLLRPRRWNGQTDLPLVLQASTVQTLNDAQVAELRTLWDHGGAVVLLEAQNDDLARLHAILGTLVPMTVPLDPPFDRFAVYVAGQTATGHRRR